MVWQLMKRDWARRCHSDRHGDKQARFQRSPVFTSMSIWTPVPLMMARWREASCRGQSSGCSYGVLIPSVFGPVWWKLQER